MIIGQKLREKLLQKNSSKNSSINSPKKFVKEFVQRIRQKNSSDKNFTIVGIHTYLEEAQESVIEEKGQKSGKQTNTTRFLDLQKHISQFPIF